MYGDRSLRTINKSTEGWLTSHRIRKGISWYDTKCSSSIISISICKDLLSSYRVLYPGYTIYLFFLCIDVYNNSLGSCACYIYRWHGPILSSIVWYHVYEFGQCWQKENSRKAKHSKDDSFVCRAVCYQCCHHICYIYLPHLWWSCKLSRCYRYCIVTLGMI